MKNDAVATAAEPNDFYDTLPESAQLLCDKIGSLGYKVDHNSLGYVLTNMNDPADFFGPTESLSELYEDVMAVAGVIDAEIIEENTQPEDYEIDEEPSATVELTEDAKGNVFLPGTGPIVDQQLADAAGKFHAANTEWKDAGKRRKDAKTELAAICALKPKLFKDDPDNSNAKIYHAGGLTIRISEEVKDKLEVEIDDEE